MEASGLMPKKWQKLLLLKEIELFVLLKNKMLASSSAENPIVATESDA